LLKPEIEYAQADKIKIDLTKFSKSPSKRLLEDLIRSPEGVTHTEKYGKKQPDGVKDILKRNRYEEAAKAVHKDGDTIKLDEKIIFSKK
jgi:hypothetical protein